MRTHEDWLKMTEAERRALLENQLISIVRDLREIENKFKIIDPNTSLSLRERIDDIEAFYQY